MPQEYIAKAATKRMSMPNAPSAPTAGYQMTPETVFSNVATPADTAGFGSSQSATPASNTLDFGTPAIVQGQLPDLKSVMFPGDNPFAYPNQPMSTLDTMPSALFGNDSPSAVAQYDTPMNMNPRPLFPPSFDKFGGHQDLSEGFYGNQNQNKAPNHFFNTNMSSEPGMMPMSQQQHSSLQNPGPVDEGDYWSHAPAKGNFKTGLTPGGPGVNLNLDDIFGNGAGWSTMPMDMNMGAANGQHQQQQRQHRMNQWSGPPGQEWR